MILESRPAARFLSLMTGIFNARQVETAPRSYLTGAEKGTSKIGQKVFSDLVTIKSDIGNNILIVAAYVVLSLPYMYRAVDTGLRAIDVRSLTEAAQSLGSGWFTILWRVIFPNLRVALLSGAFLTLAIVIGEFTIANYLGRPAFGPYLSLLGNNRTYEPAAVSIISFALTWAAMGAIALLGRGTRSRVELVGAH